MSAAKVHPFAAFQIRVKLFHDVFQCPFQDRCILFTHRVEVNAIQAVKCLLGKLGNGCPHPRTRNARIIQIRFHFCILRIDANTTGNRSAAGLHECFVQLPLMKRIEYNMVADGTDFRKILFRIGRGENMHFSAHFFPSQFGFIESAGGCSGEVGF